jgi:hypothetical protein
MRRTARTAVHNKFAVPALYRDGVSANGVPVPLTVRWHAVTVAEMGDMHDGGWAQVLDRVDRLLFNRDDLAAASPPVLLRKEGKVLFPDYGYAAFSLDSEEPPDGPVTIVWRVTRIGVLKPT